MISILCYRVSTLSSTAYNDTLGKYHPWIVRKAAGLAMYSLPIKSVFLQRIDTSADAEQKFKTLLEEISQRGTPIYKITEDLYTDMKLHDLPWDVSVSCGSGIHCFPNVISHEIPNSNHKMRKYVGKGVCHADIFD